MSNISFSEEAWDDYLYWQLQDRKTLKKINRLLRSILRDGALAGEGKPEKLLYAEGAYSRRINSKDRLVYSFHDGNIVVESCRGHYEDG